MTRTNICNFCGGSEIVEKHVEYIYRHKGNYMVFRNVPAEVCLRCGTRYYAADVILTIEQRFFEVYEEQREPEMTVKVPIEAFG